MKQPPVWIRAFTMSSGLEVGVNSARVGDEVLTAMAWMVEY